MKHTGTSTGPTLIIHGGAGRKIVDAALRKTVRETIERVAKDTWPMLADGASALDTACAAVKQLEAAPCFNAGIGSALQRDGMARLSASLMDGDRETFSAVALATHIRHPSELVRALQDRSERAFGPLGAQLLARELGIPPENPITVRQAQIWLSKLQELESETPRGTVGAVVRDRNGKLAAATSTGGNVSNSPDRMSDVSTVAGNYATSSAAVSCTGTGEHIIDAGLAVRLETRVRDGKTIVEASEQCIEEATKRKASYGWIGVDLRGNWVICYTTEDMTAAVATPESSTPFVISPL